jgi:predicted N-acyltransferase
VPVTTHSLHFLSHPGLSRAVADYLDEERAAVRADQTYLARHAPFRDAAREDF